MRAKEEATTGQHLDICFGFPKAGPLCPDSSAAGVEGSVPPPCRGRFEPSRATRGCSPSPCRGPGAPLRSRWPGAETGPRSWQPARGHAQPRDLKKVPKEKPLKVTVKTEEKGKRIHTHTHPGSKPCPPGGCGIRRPEEVTRIPSAKGVSLPFFYVHSDEFEAVVLTLVLTWPHLTFFGGDREWPFHTSCHLCAAQTHRHPP